MSNENRYRDYKSYITGFEDAKNGITEHYETALAQKKEAEELANRREQFDKISDEQIYDDCEYWELLLREAGNYIGLEDFGKGYEWDVLDKKLTDYGIKTYARWTGEYYNVMLSWDENVKLGMLKRFTELYGLQSITFDVETDGEEKGNASLWDFCSEINFELRRAWLKRGHNTKDIFELDINDFERFMYAMGYTNKICKMNEDEESEDKKQELLDKMHSFWNLKKDDWIEEYNKKQMWAALHGDAEAKVKAFWSVDNTN